MVDRNSLENILKAIAEGKLSPQQGAEELKYLNFESIEDFAKIDHNRQVRTGFPEVIWSQGKTAEQIIKIIKVMQPKTPVVMVTRVDTELAQTLQFAIPELIYYPVARIIALGQNPVIYQGKISIVTAGTADLAVAEEAAMTAQLCGFEVQRLWDVGVAGIHRLLSHRHLLAEADVLIVVAGMEGALPSVVAGLVSCPVIAVPTSIGYGSNFGGLSALLTMLNSCATGIGVVNIDNGFGAAMLAGQILRLANKFKKDNL